MNEQTIDCRCFSFVVFVDVFSIIVFNFCPFLFIHLFINEYFAINFLDIFWLLSLLIC